MILELRDGPNRMDSAFIVMPDDYDGSEPLENWASTQFDIMNDFFCSIGYGRYIKEAFEKAAKSNYSNS